MEPLRILDLRDSPWVDGPGRTILQTAQAIDKSTCRIVVGGCCSDESSNAYLDRAAELGLEALPIYEKRAFDPGIVDQIVVAIDRLDIDIVHCHDFRTDFAGLLAGRRRDVALVSTCHGWIANDLKGICYRSVDKRLLRGFDRVIAVSQAVANTLIESGVNNARISVIENALVLSDFRPNPEDRSFREELGLSDSSILIGKIGRLSPEKGHRELLESVALILKRRPEVYLAIVGIGPERDHLEQYAERLSIGENVRFVGYREDMQQVYNGVDLIVQSSLTEGMPNVVLEALLMQKPVVATDVGGTAEVVQHEETGCLVEPGSAEALCAGISYFIENKIYFEKMAIRGSELVAKRFNHADRVQRIASLYSEVAKRGAS